MASSGGVNAGDRAQKIKDGRLGDGRSRARKVWIGSGSMTIEKTLGHGKVEIKRMRIWTDTRTDGQDGVKRSVTTFAAAASRCVVAVVVDDVHLLGSVRAHISRQPFASHSEFSTEASQAREWKT